LEDILAQVSQDSGLPFFMEATMIAAWELWKLEMITSSIDNNQANRGVQKPLFLSVD
jgi:hypothetical protein